MTVSLLFHRAWCEKLVVVFFKYRNIIIFGIITFVLRVSRCCPTQLEEAIPMSFLQFIHVGHVTNDLCAIVVRRKFTHSSSFNPSLISMYGAFKIQTRLRFRNFLQYSNLCKNLWMYTLMYTSCNEGKKSPWMPVVCCAPF